ncbi:MAG TPA: ectonucleotide pyrophosphatase/phosphodiesterase [Acidobacteriaceae bacterium]|jgi:alkaline phosphatase D|nr:ectonucleotide pyrophosphatase/phosphodiesterase [Acidobacteriaceae bacterium]
MARRLGLLPLVLLCLLGAAWAQTDPAGPVITVPHGPNAPAQLSKHYVVLVSLDGFRYDYARKYGARHLLAIAAHGASVPDGMIPSYPSLTFPNHYTLVTGLYPEHHGIVGNEFYDPARKQRYSYKDPKTNSDGTWYGGTPLWSLAEKQGMRSACFFWPGSEAEIAGERPTYYLHYDDKFPDEQRIDQVITWLRLPPEQRPHFITLYYPNVDHAGHQFGPDSPQTAEAVRHVDALMGTLDTDLKMLHLPIDLIIVSDHGMAKIQGSWIDLSTYAPLDGFVTVGSSLYAPSENAANFVYQKLKAADAAFMVYRRANVPAELHFNSNPREGDPVIVARGPYAIRARAPPPDQEDRAPAVGSHGFDPTMMPDMKAVFYAEGPDIRPHVVLKPFENVNLFPLITKILGLDAPPVDGSLGVLEGVLMPAANE